MIFSGVAFSDAITDWLEENDIVAVFCADATGAAANGFGGVRLDVGWTGVPNAGCAGAGPGAGAFPLGRGEAGSVAFGPATVSDGKRGCVTVPTSRASMSSAVISGIFKI
jgi:hypothetical protein